MPNFPAIGHNVDADFMAIVDPASVTHPLPIDGQTPWGDTFRLWSGDVEASVDQLEDAVQTVAGDLAALQAVVAAMFGPGISRIEAITRTAYDLLAPPVATTLYLIDENL